MEAYYLCGLAICLLALLYFIKSVRKNKKHQSVQSKTPKNPVQQKEQKKQQIKVQTKIAPKAKKIEDIMKEHSDLFVGNFKLKAANSMHNVTAIDFKGSKVLLANTKNQMTLFNLKGWKPDTKNTAPQKYFVSLDNNGASAVCIGQKYYYVALTFDKTIAFYQFKGENGVYFKEVSKFPRNIFKSNPSAIKVSKQEHYIVTTGSEADAVVDVWSMKGQKLASENTFLIYNYGTSFGSIDILVRGWTSQIKIFGILQNKDNTFKKLQKKQHLAHEQSPLAAAIDNKDMYSVSISKSHKVKVWNLFDSNPQRNIPTPDPLLSALEPTNCSIYTFESAHGHFKTLITLTYPQGIVITDIHLKILTKVEGLQVKQTYMNGTTKTVFLGTVSAQGVMSVLNLAKELEKVSEVIA